MSKNASVMKMLSDVRDMVGLRGAVPILGFGPFRVGIDVGERLAPE